MRLKGSERMNTRALKAKMMEKNVSLDKMAEGLGVHKSTLYRKLSSGGKTMSVYEAQICGAILGLTANEMASIFFGHKVAE